jgi:hypothetical protein
MSTPTLTATAAPLPPDPVPTSPPLDRPTLNWPADWVTHTVLPFHRAMKDLAELRRNLPGMLADHPLADHPDRLKAALRADTTARLLNELDGPAQAACGILLDAACDEAVPIRQAALARAAEERRRAAEAEQRRREEAEAARLRAEQAERDQFAQHLAAAGEGERRKLLALQAERERAEAARWAQWEADRAEFERWQQRQGQGQPAA